MKVVKAFKYRLKTNKEVEEKFTRFAGHTRFVWNKALSMNMHRLENKYRIMDYHTLDFLTKLWKRSEEYGFLKECPSQAIQQKLMDLSKAFKDGFDKSQPGKRMPRYKKKGQHESFRYPQGVSIKGNQIFLPKIGWVRFWKSQEVCGKIKNVTVSLRAGHWYISIQTEYEQRPSVHPSKSIVGIDLGIARFATLSTGEHVKPLNIFRKFETQLAKAQRHLSRKVKFSNNWKRQRSKIRKIHAKIARVRLDFLHKASTDISKNHAVIVMENLRISNMSASAKGDLENPGRNVKAKSGLNKSILDQGWYEFRRQLEYKQLWQGGEVLLVDPKNTSITCPKCDHISKENRRTQSEFECTDCGYANNADHVGAYNVLRAGHARLACGDIGGHWRPSPRTPGS